MITRKLSETGKKLIQHFESCLSPIGGGRFIAYLDSAGVWTIGWGHTGLQHKDGTVHKGRVITQAEADELFAYDMHQFESRVAALVKVPLNDDEHAALVSFDFNTGGLTLGDGSASTLLRKLNLGDREGASVEFLRWNKVKGRVVSGLDRRRHAEQALFESNYKNLAATTEQQVVVA